MFHFVILPDPQAAGDTVCLGRLLSPCLSRVCTLQGCALSRSQPLKPNPHQRKHVQRTGTPAVPCPGAALAQHLHVLELPFQRDGLDVLSSTDNAA